MLIGTFIVGPALPNFDFEREQVRAYYEKRYGSQNAFNYAYGRFKMKLNNLPIMFLDLQTTGALNLKLKNSKPKRNRVELRVKNIN